MAPIEILATFFAVFVIVKLVVVTVKPGLWMKWAKGILKNELLITLIYFVFAVIVGYYIFAELTVVQVAAVTLWVSMLIGIGFIPYSKILLKTSDELLSVGISKTWLSMLIWAVLAVWVLYAVFI
ncbi:MAG: hypothetical protein V3T60_16430 [Candidatus Binatia bacterium]|jgi:hypothetical protein